MAQQYAEPKADLKPIYDKIIKTVQGFGGDVELDRHLEDVGDGDAGAAETLLVQFQIVRGARAPEHDMVQTGAAERGPAAEGGGLFAGLQQQHLRQVQERLRIRRRQYAQELQATADDLLHRLEAATTG